MEDGTIFNELLRQDSLLSYAHNNHNNITNNVVVHEKFSSHDIRASLQSDMGKCGNNNGSNKPETSTTRKSVSKNDRHSKIITAQGPRDRRMRLSLDVAKKFFKLQDILGFDKASETVNWLLMNSKSDIHELLSHQRSSFSGVSNSASSTSKCELLTNSIDDEQKAKSSCSSNLKEKKRASRGARKNSYLLRPLAKETREMARKRARDRTVEKTSKLGCASGEVDQLSNIRPCLDLAMNQDVNRDGSWIINQPENISSHFQFEQGYIGDNSSSSKADNWNPSFSINYQPNGGVLPHEHQLNYFQRLGNLWGDDNN